MLGNEAQASSIVQMLAAGAKANTAAATSGWIDVRQYEGDILIAANAGTVTAGSLTLTVEDATDGSGTGAAALTLNEGAFTVVTTANDPLSQKRTVNANSVRGWIRVVGTIVTGPVDLAVDCITRPKYV